MSCCSHPPQPRMISAWSQRGKKFKIMHGVERERKWERRYSEFLLAALTGDLLWCAQLPA